VIFKFLYLLDWLNFDVLVVDYCHPFVVENGLVFAAIVLELYRQGLEQVICLQALFRALKTKHATPKYGLIYHASLIGQAAPKHKGKISRSLAAKTALAIRYDALADGDDNSMGLESRIKVHVTMVWKHVLALYM
jgi:hypothetical protein